MSNKKTIKYKAGKLFGVLRNTLTAEAARLCYYTSKLFFTSKQFWLIGETENQAQENGFYFFKWVRENHPEIPIYYVISPKFNNLSKLKTLGNVLYTDTFKQAYCMYHAKYIISTHGLWMVPNELGFLKKLTRKKLNAKGVMLNHGFCFLKNGIKFYHKNVFPLNDLIISTSQKHKEIFTKVYGYDSDNVVITGYPRFDDLKDSSKDSKSILYMPTFRDNEDNLGAKFKETELYRNISSLMSNGELISFLADCNIVLSVYLHHNIQKYSSYIKEYESRTIKVVTNETKTVQQLLKESKLLITDYSSVMFDFFYMNKPFISYQFDRSDFLSSRDDLPIIDITEELPGYIVTKEHELVDAIKNIHSSDYKVDKKFLDIKDEYFMYSDKNNCSRVFEEIKKI